MRSLRSRTREPTQEEIAATYIQNRRDPEKSFCVKVFENKGNACSHIYSTRFDVASDVST